MVLNLCTNSHKQFKGTVHPNIFLFVWFCTPLAFIVKTKKEDIFQDIFFYVKEKKLSHTDLERYKGE